MSLDGLVPLSAGAFALASLLIELTPGPNMTWLVLVAAKQGRRAGFMAVGGIALGLALIGGVAATGVAEIIQRSNLAYAVLRWSGIVFLLYLAFDAWRGADNDRTGRDNRYFLRGLMANLLNPKAFVFYVTVLPTFVTQGRDLLSETLTLTFIYVLIATLIHASLVLLAGGLTPFLTDPARQTLVRRSLALILAAVAIWFGWSTTH